jgi:hypothetical protein
MVVDAVEVAERTTEMTGLVFTSESLEELPTNEMVGNAKDARERTLGLDCELRKSPPKRR